MGREPSFYQSFLPEILQGEKRDYQPFVVLAAPRSGSSMLVHALQTHTNILAYSEIYHNKQVQLNFPDLVYGPEELIEARNEAPADILKYLVYGSYTESVAAAGFKIFPEHLSAWPAVKQYLADFDNLKVVYLRRQNSLREFVSLKTSMMTNVWGIDSAEERKVTTFELEEEACRKYFDHVEARHRESLAAFEGRELCDVAYEQMVADFPTEADRILRFLGVSEQELTIKTIKQNVSPLSDTLTNYDALKASFAGTNWGHFFDD